MHGASGQPPRLCIHTLSCPFRPGRGQQALAQICCRRRAIFNIHIVHIISIFTSIVIVIIIVIIVISSSSSS
jgi:hypothetical protein